MVAANAGNGPLWARLDALYDKRLAESIPQYIQPELFHYTTVEGLKGIVESNSLWATSAYHLNDSSEIEYGCHLVTEAIDEWLKTNDTRGLGRAARVPLLVLQFLRDSFHEPSFRVGRHVGIYLSCFCESGNLLSQWRAYGQPGGYSIGMLASELEVGVSAPGFYGTRLLKVEYSRDNQRAKIHSLLSDFVVIAEDDTLYTFPAEPEAMKRILSDLGLFLQELVMDEIVSFKNPAFAEEREWRIVARPRLVEMQRLRQQQANVAEQQPASPIQYRHAKGSLVPYLSLSSTKGKKLPIHSVRIGPSLEKFPTEYALLGFLIAQGHKQVQVLGSDLPVKL